MSSVQRLVGALVSITHSFMTWLTATTSPPRPTTSHRSRVRRVAYLHRSTASGRAHSVALHARSRWDLIGTKQTV